MEFDQAVDREKEIQFQEVSSEALEELGWKPYERTDGHVFTILIPQVLDANRAFEMSYVFAKHQMKDKNGEVISTVTHIDRLYKAKEPRIEVMLTEFDPKIGHQPTIVLKKSLAETQASKIGF